MRPAIWRAGVPRLLILALPALALLALAVVPAGTSAAAPAATLSGACQFSGPIAPTPPITVVPKPGAHFSYHGTGTCTGTLDGTAVTKAPITVTFTNVATAFDTCELGPDFNLIGTLRIDTGQRVASFTITINLARLALAGPFSLTTPGGGNAVGTAQFMPPDTAGALKACGGSGVATATLSGSFNTLSALMGNDVAAPDPAPPQRGTHKHRPHKRAKGHHRHHRA